MEIITQAEPWDAIVVGSGATGGAAARKLTEGGLRVLVLEAGRPIAGAGDYGSFFTNGIRLLYRHFISHRQNVQEAHPTYWATHPDFFVDDHDNPYTTPEGKPFRWIRPPRRRPLARVGRRHAALLRLRIQGREPRRIRPRLAHHARRPRPVLRRSRAAPRRPRFAEGLPQMPDGEFLPPRAMTPAEAVFKERVERQFGDRKVLISRGIHGGRGPAPGEIVSEDLELGDHAPRRGGHGAADAAPERRRARILVEPDGRRATGVEFIDALTGEVQEARARMVFLCASTIESLRILMNSQRGRTRGASAPRRGCSGTTSWITARATSTSTCPTCATTAGSTTSSGATAS
jgi:hypothetical protein